MQRPFQVNSRTQTHVTSAFHYLILLVDDRIVSQLITERLKKPDCQINGWVLDGYPTSQSQIEELVKVGLSPQLVVALELRDSIVYERIE